MQPQGRGEGWQVLEEAGMQPPEGLAGAGMQPALVGERYRPRLQRTLEVLELGAAERFPRCPPLTSLIPFTVY